MANIYTYTNKSRSPSGAALITWLLLLGLLTAAGAAMFLLVTRARAELAGPSGPHPCPLPREGGGDVAFPHGNTPPPLAGEGPGAGVLGLLTAPGR